MTEITLLDRYKGAMVGVLTGDMLGARFEGKGPKEVTELLEADSGLNPCDYENPWDKEATELLPAGMPTDDSDQTAVLAHSLIVCNGLNIDHLRTALQENVIGGKSLLWAGKATGSGKTTQNALSDDPVLVAEAMQNPIGTNGSLMRCTPLSLILSNLSYVQLSTDRRIYFADEARAYVSEMSSVTHANQNSIDACWMYTKVMGNILKGIKINWTSVAHMETELEKRVLLRLLDETDTPVDPGQWPGRGEAEFSLYVALWCFINSTSFADGIEKAIRIGGDTDTYAAIAGGLLGAYYGYEAIPPEWRNACLGHTVMLEYAEKLFVMNQAQ